MFTTELRTLCESTFGAIKHLPGGSVDHVIEGCWEQIFTNEWNTYDPAYKKVLCRKILRHYWMREIGQETTDLFLHYLNTRMEEIMPYYNDLYKSATLEFNPLFDYDLQTTSKRTTDGETASQSTVSGTDSLTGADTGEVTESNSGTSSGTKTGKITDKNNTTGQDVTKFSDTPQGELSGVLNGNYLTNATVVDKTNGVNGERNTQDSATETSENTGNRTSEHNRTEQRTNESTKNDSGTAKTTEDYVLSVKGKSGGKSYSKLLTEFRNTLINIDKMIIDELNDLFMGLWA